MTVVPIQQRLPNTMRRFPLPLRLAACVAFALATSTAHAVVLINVTTDTATDFAGSFSVPGYNFAQQLPTTFSALPITDTKLYLERASIHDQFETLGGGGGTPDDPQFLTTSSFSTFTLSGTYTNGGSSGDQTVNWSFSNLQETNYGQFGGTFSGDFSFSLVAVPEPTETAVAVGLGLGVFTLVRRNRGASVV